MFRRHLFGHFRHLCLAQQFHELPFNFLTPGIENATAGNDNEIVVCFEMSMIQSECLSQKPLRPIPVNGTAKGTLAGDSAKTKPVAAPIAYPYDHEFADNVDALVENLLEIT